MLSIVRCCTATAAARTFPEVRISKLGSTECVHPRLCAARLCGKVRLHSEWFCIPSVKGLRTKPPPQHAQRHFNDRTACAKLGNLIWCRFVTWKPKAKALFPVTDLSHPSAFSSLLCEAFHLHAPLFTDLAGPPVPLSVTAAALLSSHSSCNLDQHKTFCSAS